MTDWPTTLLLRMLSSPIYGIVITSLCLLIYSLYTLLMIFYAQAELLLAILRSKDCNKIVLKTLIVASSILDISL